MKFLIDAQLPKGAVVWISEMGFDAVHTSTLPRGNRTTDTEIAVIADSEDRVVVTKDSDFADSHQTHGRPARLVIVVTGNIKNDELERLFRSSLQEIVLKLQHHRCLRLSTAGLDVLG